MGNAAALRYDLWNGVRHYFGEHTKYDSLQNTNTDTSYHYITKYACYIPLYAYRFINSFLVTSFMII